MIVRKSRSVWEGSLNTGRGTMEIGAGNLRLPYSFSSRFENATGTNPEELIGAAHSGCFSMALSMILGNAGYKPARITTTASVGLDKVGDGFEIVSIKLATEASVPKISNDEFQKCAVMAKNGCPVSIALKNVKSIELEAKLV